MKTRSFLQTCSFKTFGAVPALIFSVLFVAGSYSTTAAADQVPDQSKVWASGLRAALKTKHVSMSPVDLATNTIPNNVRVQLEMIAEDQAQIWADTILEGDYIAENDVLVDGVEMVQMNSVFLGYRITYSSLAFETSDCDPDADLNACKRGKIVESSFVAPSLDSWIRDAKHLAEFVPDETNVSLAE